MASGSGLWVEFIFGTKEAQERFQIPTQNRFTIQKSHLELTFDPTKETVTFESFLWPMPSYCTLMARSKNREVLVDFESIACD